MYKMAEILELAMQVETNGARLFTRLARRVDDPSVKALLEESAEEELQHYRFFEQLHSKCCRNEMVYESFPGEFDLFAEAVIEEHFFVRNPDLELILEDIKTGHDVLDLMVRLEKDAIMFFEGLKPLVSQEDRALIDRIVKEERQHLIKCSRKRREIKNIASYRSKKQKQNKVKEERVQ